MSHGLTKFDAGLLAGVITIRSKLVGHQRFVERCISGKVEPLNDAAGDLIGRTGCATPKFVAGVAAAGESTAWVGHRPLLFGLRGGMSVQRHQQLRSMIVAIRAACRSEVMSLTPTETMMKSAGSGSSKGNQLLKHITGGQAGTTEAEPVHTDFKDFTQAAGGTSDQRILHPVDAHTGNDGVANRDKPSWCRTGYPAPWFAPVQLQIGARIDGPAMPVEREWAGCPRRSGFRMVEESTQQGQFADSLAGFDAALGISGPGQRKGFDLAGARVRRLQIGTIATACRTAWPAREPGENSGWRPAHFYWTGSCPED